jgi:hypothetical protein
MLKLKRPDLDLTQTDAGSGAVGQLGGWATGRQMANIVLRPRGAQAIPTG